MGKTMQQEIAVKTEPENEIELELPENEQKENITVVEEENVSSEPENQTEVEEYSDSVKKRIGKLTYKLREQERQGQEALDFAKKVQADNKQLQEKLKTSDEAMFSEYGNRVKSDLDIAKSDYKSAYDSGNTDGIIEAQEQIAKLTVESESLRRVANQKKTAVQPPVEQQTKTKPVAQPHPKAQEWASKNNWFGEDQPMTFASFGIHKELMDEGFDGKTDDYYQELDNRLYKIFPDRFNKNTSSERPVQTVASPTRKTKAKSARNKVVKLTQSQVAVAKKLGVPLEEYAKYVKE
tara:strand:- start:544 stop:1425 length:882 start_codon:yes stop_codon:yes gene_type:complete